MFPPTNNSLRVSGMAGGRTYDVLVEVYSKKPDCQPQKSNKLVSTEVFISTRLKLPFQYDFILGNKVKQVINHNLNKKRHFVKKNSTVAKNFICVGLSGQYKRRSFGSLDCTMFAAHCPSFGTISHQ